MHDLSSIESVLKQYSAHQPEFHQAVLEVVDDVLPLVEDNKDYQDANVLERLIEPDRIIRFRVCWEDDKKNIQVNRGWRVQFNNSVGAYKGGLRFHSSVNESVLKFLSFEQCFKNVLTGLPMGGGKGGADFDPKDKSDTEVRRFCQAFMQELYRHIGSNMDVPAGDIGVGAREIGYLFGHYLKIANTYEGVLTGKGLSFGGSAGRTEATGYGCVYFLQEMLHAHDMELADQKVIISGAGNVAQYAAKKCLDEDAKVMSMSDSGGTVYFKDGMTQEQFESIQELKNEERGRLKNWVDGQKGVEFRKDEMPWSIEADIALPCATQNEVDEDSAKSMVKNNVKAISEGANMPLTQEAVSVVREAGIIYGLGKAANAGGVAVSGLERSQNAMMQPWSFEKVDKELRNIMKDIHKRCVNHAEKYQDVYDYKKGANRAAFVTLADALVAYGTK
jgi:glutamate dehydrogenase (NADP+)